MKKGNNVIIEHSVNFLGRFLTKDVNSVSIEKLRAIIRYDKGQKTKIRLSVTGLSSGHKYKSALGRHKMPYEFTPLIDLKDVVKDCHCLNVLLFIISLGEAKFEILAYRTKTEKVTQAFVECFSYIKNDQSNWDLKPRQDSESLNSFHTTYSSIVLPDQPKPFFSTNLSSNFVSADIQNTIRGMSNVCARSRSYSAGQIDQSNMVAFDRNSALRKIKRRSSSSTLDRLIPRPRNIQNTKNASVQTYISQDLPANVKEKGICVVKSYCSTENIYMQNGSSVRDVCCQCIVDPHNDAVPQNRDFTAPRKKLSEIEQNRRSSLASESFRRQVNELTHEVRQLRHTIQQTSERNGSGKLLSEDCDGKEYGTHYPSADSMFDPLGLTHTNRQEGFKIISDKITGVENNYNFPGVETKESKSVPKVVWSPTLEQVKFQKNNLMDEYPLHTSTPRQQVPVYNMQREEVKKLRTTVSNPLNEPRGNVFSNSVPSNNYAESAQHNQLYTAPVYSQTHQPYGQVSYQPQLLNQQPNINSSYIYQTSDPSKAIVNKASNAAHPGLKVAIWSDGQHAYANNKTNLNQTSKNHRQTSRPNGYRFSNNLDHVNSGLKVHSPDLDYINHSDAVEFDTSSNIHIAGKTLNTLSDNMSGNQQKNNVVLENHLPVPVIQNNNCKRSKHVTMLTNPTNNVPVTYMKNVKDNSQPYERLHTKQLGMETTNASYSNINTKSSNGVYSVRLKLKAERATPMVSENGSSLNERPVQLRQKRSPSADNSYLNSRYSTSSFEASHLEPERPKKSVIYIDTVAKCNNSDNSPPANTISTLNEVSKGDYFEDRVYKTCVGFL